ncbi:hypothetical protein CONLIGDRAFT_608580 [Coniochaeta ligniaria NRRL 30616]|uniref:Uncharacterized protein n=1 Tax=Coniochaeta ligniaria NRRL 30616 TaxID=1408157 RepID=A0A1J7J6G1_9PEZI|nr:hypothetical protein CONLIGDRAFT_608580 [Coniochaeta ligniaria NRRL 30616]
MSPADETREQIQKVLQPYVLPREEVAYRRRILAAHLESCVGDSSLSSPLALVQPSRAVSTPAEARGLHREYLKALNANISARAEYDKVQAEISRDSKSVSGAAGARTAPKPATSNPLEEHLVKIKLQRKQERLRTVEKHIGLLNQRPAASATFMDPEEMFKDTRLLPDVPRKLVEGLALGEATGKAGLTDLIDKLEKQVLRAKFLLKSEEKLLDTVKGRSTVRPENITEHAKLTALNATRTELINWMEAELSKVPGDEPDGEEDENHGATTQATADSGQTDEQLAGIRSKYAQYLAARKSLLQLVAQQPQPAMLPKTNSDAQQERETPAPPPVTYLLTPYLERLLSLSREQKSLITQKSHLNITIAKQLKETVQTLDHLAEESNLLPRHPIPGTSRRKLGFGDALGNSETLNSSSRVKPWVYAADSAKIATLEAVAEKIEEGQVALEGSMRAIQEIEQLLGRNPAGEGAEKADVTDDDIWLTEDKPSARAGPARKHARKESKAGNATDLWAFLDGSLGLLKANDE